MALSWLGWGSPILFSVKLAGVDERKTKTFDTGEAESLTCHVFHAGDDIEGAAEAQPSGRAEHGGIRAELVGVLEQYHDRGSPKEFVRVTQVLAGAGVLTDPVTFNFSFKKASLPHETFYGVNVRVRYYVRVVAASKGTATSTALAEKSIEFAVERFSPRPTSDTKIKMEVGIEEYLHLEFEYDKEAYGLDDVLTGRVAFRLSQLRLKHAELAILRREKTKSKGMAYTESDTLCKYEVMDGTPARGTIVPLRLYLGAYDLTPTYRRVEGVFSVEYFLNLVLIDSDDRRYFKQHEITLFREAPSARVARRKKEGFISGMMTSEAKAASASASAAAE